jgi:hypothetical protein
MVVNVYPEIYFSNFEDYIDIIISSGHIIIGRLIKYAVIGLIIIG